MADKTPDDFYRTHLGKSFDYDGSWGAQCVEGFYAFGRYMGFVIPTGVGSAKYYANSKWQNILSKWFNYLPASAPIQSGDWVIWPNGTHGHVAMYYDGKAFGQNQIGSGNGHAFSLNPWNFNNRSCAYRVKSWANSNWGTSSSGGTPSSGFRTYQLSDRELKGLAYLCQREQGSAVGAAKEASLIANRFELYPNAYPKKDTKTLYTYARNSGWWANSTVFMDNPSPTSEVLSAVKDVLVNGNRKLPNYIDEHDCFSDIRKIIPSGSVYSKSSYIKDTTKIYNKYSKDDSNGYYIFYEWGDDSKSQTDPFGYTPSAKGVAAQKGLNGVVGGGAEATGATGVYSPLYTSKNDRNDATFREVAYMTPTGERTLKSSNIPLSVVNYTNVLASQYDSLAASSGLLASSTGAQWNGGKVDISSVTPPLAKQFFQACLDLGCHPVAMCGIGGNIKQECSWNQSLVEGGGSGPGVGICQWTSAGRKSAFLKAVPDWRTNFSGQVKFMYDELQKSYPTSRELWKGKVLHPKEGGGITRIYFRGRWVEYYLPVPMTTGSELTVDEQGAVLAAQLFLCSFEMPGIPHEQTRYDEAKRLFNQLKFIESAPSATSQGQDISQGIKSLSGEILTLGTPISFSSTITLSSTKVLDITKISTLYNLWKIKGSKSLNNIASIDDKYLVAVPSMWGAPGTILVIVLDNGITIVTVVAANINMSEIQFVCPQNTDVSKLQLSLTQLNWRTHRVIKMINYK